MTMQPPDKTDEELVKMYQTSLDKNIVGVLFKRHSLMCYGVSNKYLKDEDAAQDATMQIFEKLFSDLTKHEILNFRSWLHSVCRNYCLMELRKPMRVMRMRESEDDHENEFMELEQFLHQEENPEDKEGKLQSLELAIQELKDSQRECIELFYIKQKSYEEVSILTGYTPNEVKSYIQNGKRNLKIILGKRGISFLMALTIWTLNCA